MALLLTYYFSPNDNAHHSADSEHVCGLLSGESSYGKTKKNHISVKKITNLYDMWMKLCHSKELACIALFSSSSDLFSFE